ncbi:MAG TPA: sigma-70 family RNA polymerase sigma factor [Ktedonobacterales bacterium]|jgi:RNA polymerase sigma-70 factor (ECF subfamily)
MQQHAHVLLNDAPDAALYQRFAPALFAYFLKQTVSREDAEDLLLEVFLAALEQGKLATLEEEKQRAWLWAVARNKAADHFRRRGRSTRVDLSLVAEFADMEGMEPEQMLVRQEELAHLADTIRQLPTPQQHVVQLRFGHGLSHSEIAMVLHKREGTTRMLLSRALKALRSSYQRNER